VICSTDSPAIAEAARDWGAEVPFLRPAELATDSAASVDVVLHALDALAEPWDAVVLVQPTSPLVVAGDIVGAVQLHEKTGAPVVSVCENEHPVEWSYRLAADGSLIAAVPGDCPQRRQDCRPSYRLNGAVYVAPPDILRAYRDFVVEGTRGFVMPAERSIDIDSPADLLTAGALGGNRSASPMIVGNRPVGPGHPCLIIAEAGVNHNGDLELARRLVDAAAEAGADAVKFQTWITEKLCLPGAEKADYQKINAPGPDDQFTMLKRLELPYAWHAELKARTESRGLAFLSTPDEIQSARFLCELGVPALKIGSAELSNLPYLRQLAGLGKPLIVSTGMGSLAEVARAVAAVRQVCEVPLALLHCVSAYPAPEEEMNLRCIGTLARTFDVPVGLSDHTRGWTAAILGVAAGASILEKHFTLDRTMPGPDHAASADPAELADLVRAVRKAEAMLGSGDKQAAACEENTRRAVRRTLLYARSLRAGDRVGEEDFEALRCGLPGLPPQAAIRLSGRTLRTSVRQGAAVAESDFA
jgi:N-acetylneuraminate synthase/N,N'-diacetyllegionaminate synthase